MSHEAAPWAVHPWHRVCPSRRDDGLRCQLRRKHPRWSHMAYNMDANLRQWEVVDVAINRRAEEDRCR